jgi:hypothetical protein
MVTEKQIKKDLERSGGGGGLIEVLSWHLPRGIENHRKPELE